MLCSDRTHFSESTEGMTYVKAKHHETVAKRIIPVIRGALGDVQKWGLSMRRHIVKIKNREGNVIDYYDLDYLLGEMIALFKTQRENNKQEIMKTF